MMFFRAGVVSVSNDQFNTFICSLTGMAVKPTPIPLLAISEFDG
ncbi:MAG TPA: hypothetical protein V6D09_05350 [Leptolyngbyaceae cyanobacterium]